MRKRHSPEEIAAKLSYSSEMAKAGKPQTEIARALGISLMTYHRWRKATRQSSTITSSSSTKSKVIESAARGDLVSRISQMHVENSRLRQIVTDLLLETDRLEEALATPLSSDLKDASMTLMRKPNSPRRAPKRRQELISTPDKLR